MDYDALQAALAAMQAERDTLQHGRMPRSVPSAETNSHESAGAVTGSKCPERSGCAFQSTSPSAASKGSSTLLRKLPSRRCQCSSSDLREDDMCAPGHNSFSGGPSMDYKGHVEKHIRSLSIGFDKSLFLNALDTTAEREMREMLNDEVEGQTLKTLEAIHDSASFVCDSNASGQCDVENGEQDVPSVLEVLHTKNRAKRKAVRERTLDIPEVRSKNQHKETFEMYDPTLEDEEA